MTPNQETYRAVQDLRRNIAAVAELCDALLYAKKVDARESLPLLRLALDRLVAIALLARQALDAAGIP
jgi:hypothetical protein